jgi:hypothetical protein
VDRRTQQIRHEIDQTRADLSETIDAIQHRLKPANMVATATDSVKSAATQKVRDMTETANETAQHAMDYTRQRANQAMSSARQNSVPLAIIGIGAAWLLTNRSRNPSATAARRKYGTGSDGNEYGNYGGGTSATGTYDRHRESIERAEGMYAPERDGGLMARIRSNPVPAALAGVGLGWLAFANQQTNTRRRSNYEQDLAKAPSVDWRGGSSEPGLAARTGDYASQTTDSVRRMAQRRQNQLRRMIDENPLLVGAGALMLGAAFGLAVPETDTENEWMGDARDTVMTRARDMARDAAEQVQNTASGVADAAKKATDSIQP